MYKFSKYIYLVAILLLPFVFYSCSASGTTRYDREKEKKETGTENETKKYKEDFDIIPFRTIMDIKEKPENTTAVPDINPWYGYKEKDTSSVQEKTIVGTTNGFRVRVYVTDKLDEADSLKTELSLKLTQKNIYVIFDPPFYKVEVGDFVSMSDAKDLNFKLNQMGYTGSRVIASTVNIFE